MEKKEPSNQIKIARSQKPEIMKEKEGRPGEPYLSELKT